MSEKTCDGYTCNGDLHDIGCSLGGMRGHPNPSPMDAVDSAQQDELNANRARDDIQQFQIDRLQNSARVMFFVLLLNTVAALAQIVECVYIVSTGRAK